MLIAIATRASAWTGTAGHEGSEPTCFVAARHLVRCACWLQGSACMDVDAVARLTPLWLQALEGIEAVRDGFVICTNGRARIKLGTPLPSWLAGSRLVLFQHSPGLDTRRVGTAPQCSRR